MRNAKKREIVEFCQFAESDPIEKNYNESTSKGEIKNPKKSEAPLTRGDGPGGICLKPEQEKTHEIKLYNSYLNVCVSLYVR